jgi:hypothetical protein
MRHYHYILIMKNFKLKGVNKSLTRDEMKKITGGLTYWCCHYDNGYIEYFGSNPGVCPPANNGNGTGWLNQCELI